MAVCQRKQNLMFDQPCEKIRPINEAALFSSITIKIFRALLLNVYTLTHSIHEHIIHKHINVLIQCIFFRRKALL